MSVRLTHYAGVLSRGAAFVIDVTAVLIVCTVGFEFTRALFAAIRINFTSSDGGGAVAYVAVLPVALALYCAGFWTLIGRTPGMMVLGLRVVTGDGGAPGLTRSLVRAFGYWVSAILLLGFAWIAIDRRRQGFHDKLAGTFVVYDWEPHLEEALGR
jgi:uncharacterized RDD family membrane protein YckC